MVSARTSSRRAAEIRAKGVGTTIDVVVGEKVSEAITNYARREGADLVAIATHGRGGLARVVRGSVADGVTKSAMNSVLVFHPDKMVEKTLTAEALEKAREEATVFA